jgi:flagellar biosynthetic protein FliP
MAYKKLASLFFLTSIFVAAGLFFCADARAIGVPTLDFVREAKNPQEVALSLQILFTLTIIALAPSILVMTTCFTRIMVVLSFLKQAMGMREIPPQQIVAGLALFLTAFIMQPTWQQINEKAMVPYTAGSISVEEAFKRGSEPLKKFMLRQAREQDIALFVKISKQPRPKTPEDVSLTILIPAFIISELKTAFIIGFVIYVPFLIIDMVVASILMSMGMMMLPPQMVSLVFKIIIFVLIDGWYLIIQSLVGSFR